MRIASISASPESRRFRCPNLLAKATLPQSAAAQRLAKNILPGFELQNRAKWQGPFNPSRAPSVGTIEGTDGQPSEKLSIYQ